MKNIIIADDSSTARMILLKCLEIVGLSESNIYEAENGMEVMGLIYNHPIDLLLSDVNMPNLDGLQLIRAINSKKKYDFPIIFITSMGNSAKSDELIEEGALAVINKPISPSKLMNELKGVMP